MFESSVSVLDKPCCGKCTEIVCDKAYCASFQQTPALAHVGECVAPKVFSNEKSVKSKDCCGSCVDAACKYHDDKWSEWTECECGEKMKATQTRSRSSLTAGCDDQKESKDCLKKECPKV